MRKRKVPQGRRPIKVFHSTDCAAYQGEFESWAKEERDAFVAQLLPVIRELIRWPELLSAFI